MMNFKELISLSISVINGELTAYSSSANDDLESLYNDSKSIDINTYEKAEALYVSIFHAKKAAALMNTLISELSPRLTISMDQFRKCEFTLTERYPELENITIEEEDEKRQIQTLMMYISSAYSDEDGILGFDDAKILLQRLQKINNQVLISV